MPEFIGSTKAKLYLGDTLLNDVVYEKIPKFNGYIGNPYGISAPRAGRNFDPTKSYDIVCCFWWGEGHAVTSDSHAAFGTLEEYHYYAYPSLEIRLNTGIWYGLSSTGREWDAISKNVSMSFTQNSYNYIKMSHNSETHTITVSYSTDGKTWTVIDTTDISSFTLLTTSDRFCFGCNAGENRLRLLPEDDYHICIDKCRIVSDGNVLFGYSELPEIYPDYISDGCFWYTDRNLGHINTYQRIGAGLGFSNGYTFEACVKINSSPGEYMRVLEFAPYGRDIQAATIIACKNYGHNDTAINGTWHHVGTTDFAYPIDEVFTVQLAVDIPNSTAKLYVNGVLSDTFSDVDSNTSAMSSRGGRIYLGCGSVDYRELIGDVYSGRFYNRLLSSEEMAFNMTVDQLRFGGE